MKKGRHRRFEQRIRTEREVLSLINQRFASAPPLHGLTLSGIDYWKSQLVAHNLFDGTAEEVSRQLEAMSRSLRMEADNSREVFSREERRNMVSSSTLLQELKALIH